MLKSDRTEEKKVRTLAQKLGEDKLLEISDQMDAYARAKYVNALMNEKGWTYEETLKKCCGTEEERDIEASVGWKMSRPGLLMLFATQKGREKFVERYLTPEEAEWFWADWAKHGNNDVKGSLKKEYRRQKKLRKAKKGSI